MNSISPGRNSDGPLGLTTRLRAQTSTPLTLPMRAARTTFVVLLTLSLVFPTLLQSIKIALLATIVASVLLARETWADRSSSRQIALDLLAVGYAIVGLAWATGGLIRNNPGAAFMLTVHVAYPLLAILLWRMARPGDLAKLSKWLVIATALVLATQALFIASFFDLDGGVFFRMALSFLDEETAVVDVTDDYLLFTLPNVSTLLFMAPWLAVHSVLARKHRAASAVLFFLTVAALLLAGRRASLLALTGGLCAAFFVSRTIGHRQITSASFGRRLALLLLALAVVLALAFVSGALNIELLSERLTSIFDFNTNDSNILRRLQFESLAKGIAEHPLLGQGLGAAADYSRSDEQPWSYELSYVLLVFNFGLLGFLLFAAGVVFLLAKLAQISSLRGILESEHLSAICYLAGLTAFLIANATNPYLAKFDYMWTLFVPLAFVRIYADRRHIRFDIHQPIAGESRGT